MSRPTSPEAAAQRIVTSFELGPSRSDGTRCLTWTGYRDRDGYGITRIASKRHRVHRWAYERWTAPIPEGYQIDHLCRNTSCSNPAHLEVARLEAELAEAKRKLRGNKPLVKRKQTSRSEMAAIREWAVANGFSLYSDGRPSRPAIEAYRRAHAS